jgi:hypothetical protein
MASYSIPSISRRIAEPTTTSSLISTTCGTIFGFETQNQRAIDKSDFGWILATISPRLSGRALIGKELIHVKCFY